MRVGPSKFHCQRHRWGQSHTGGWFVSADGGTSSSEPNLEDSKGPVGLPPSPVASWRLFRVRSEVLAIHFLLMLALALVHGWLYPLHSPKDQAGKLPTWALMSSFILRDEADQECFKESKYVNDKTGSFSEKRVLSVV